eukprot:9506202-Karenia_brevis.AAC.1
MFSEVAKGYPEYSRNFDDTKKEKFPAYLEEYLEWLKMQMPESSSRKDMPKRTRKKGLPEKKGEAMSRRLH